MANPEHLAKLKEGVAAWNAWRKKQPKVTPDLTRAELAGRNLSGADFSWARLHDANLSRANLERASFWGTYLNRAILRQANFKQASLDGAQLVQADLTRATLDQTYSFKADFSLATLKHASLIEGDFRQANFMFADLTRARLLRANMKWADFTSAKLPGAKLSDAILEKALLVDTNLRRTTLTACHVYGISAWGVHLEGAVQSNLIITPEDQPTIQVDNLEVAQFIYLLLNNQKIRNVIDTITSKVVLILGRFTPERKIVLEAIRDKLRKADRLPVLFDFETPASQTKDETISTLAHMSRFVIADLTDAKSILQELRSIVPNSPSVVVQPLLLASQEEPGMWDFFQKFPWVLDPVQYKNPRALIARLNAKVIAPAEAKARALQPDSRCDLARRKRSKNM